MTRCLDCPVVLDALTHRLRCRPCGLKHRRESQNAYWRKRTELSKADMARPVVALEPVAVDPHGAAWRTRWHGDKKPVGMESRC